MLSRLGAVKLKGLHKYNGLGSDRRRDKNSKTLGELDLFPSINDPASVLLGCNGNLLIPQAP
jgi:hypothetical protein